MKNNPLIDAAAILLCMLAVIAVGHYMQTQKVNRINEKGEAVIKKAEETLHKSQQVKVDLSKFEAAVKHTE